MKRAMAAAAMWCLAALLVTGCGPAVDTAKVTGKVTVGGQPIQDITVTFNPESGRPASGVTDASGNFTLSTLSAGDGAMPGKFKVAFGMATSGEPPPSDLSAPAASTVPFHAKYSSPDTSGITAEVAAGKTNEFTWDLEKP